MSPIGRFLIGLGAAVVVVTALEGPAKADLTYTLNDTTNGVSATAVFSIVNGQIKIAVTNTEANTLDAGQAISQIQFTVNGTTTGLPTAFTELKGTTTDFSNPPVNIDDKPPLTSDHWPFAASGTTVSLFNVGGPIGGQPSHLIVAAGSTPDSSLTNTHIPSFIGEVDFFFSDPTLPSNLTTSDITGLKFAFGTGPEVPLEVATGSDTPPAVPEPSSVIVAVVCAVGFLGYGLRRRMWK